jgi:hypothetical protein
VEPRQDSAAPSLFYDDLIEPYLDDRFVDRPWLVDRIEAAIADPDCRFVLLTAVPGAGKTAFLASLACACPDRPRYFIRRDSRTPLSSGDARSFLFAIGYQLATLHPDLFRPDKLEVVVSQRIQELQSGAKAVGIMVDDLHVSPFYRTSIRVEQDATVVVGELQGLSARRMVAEERFLELSNLQHLALLDPARVLERDDPAARIVILVDALDELRYTLGRDTILDWLASCPELATNVRFLLTARPDEPLLDAFRNRQGRWLRREAIDPGEDAVQSDLRRYALLVVSGAPVGPILTARALDPETFAAHAVAKAEGNFLYLTALFQGIEQAHEQGQRQHLDRLLELHDVPHGLEGLYAFFLRLIRDQVDGQRVELAGDDTPFQKASYLPAWEGLYIPILGILAVAREPLTLPQIRSLGGIQVDEDYVRGAFSRLRQFLSGAGGHYRLYHSTLPEFLTALRTRSTHPECYFNPSKWHRRIASYYRDGAATWGEIDWRRADDYGLNHLAVHLYALRDIESWRQEFYDLICAALMWAKFDRFGSHQPFAQDVLLAVSAAKSEQPPNLVEEFRAGWAYSTLKEVSSDVPPEALAALARLGNAARARGFASLIRDGAQRSEAYRLIGTTLLDQGDVVSATELFRVALDAAEEYQDGIVAGVRDRILGEALAALRQVKHSGGSAPASEAARPASDGQRGREGMAPAVGAVHQKHEADLLSEGERTKGIQAAAVAFRVSDPIKRAEALVSSAEQLARVGVMTPRRPSHMRPCPTPGQSAIQRTGRVR